MQPDNPQIPPDNTVTPPPEPPVAPAPAAPAVPPVETPEPSMTPPSATPDPESVTPDAPTAMDSQTPVVSPPETQPAVPPAPEPAVTATSTSPPPPDTIAQIASQPHTEVPSLREVYATICSQIIKEQGQVIGALSYEQASKIEGLQVDPATYNCVISGEPLVVLEMLVDKYRQFFGNAAVEVCREAAMHLKARLPDEQIPELLRA